ncbi:MAG: gamma-glutamyl-gamma-aminobutyrate hydrolase family protein, partial [Candidatus Eremiobacteraeota bacterium]|nr:gamma-glutamyl-gamma-aminobutyrate hydrolase family protein [Candidatus Eremiobacteraeota bacterium]
SQPIVAVPIPRDYFQREPLWGNAGGYRSVNEITRAVEEAGGRAVLVFPGQELPEFDAVILPGGGDIDPSFYGQSAQADVVETDRELDQFQLEMAAGALQNGTPVLGICRGMQVLNVAAGGSLIQHLEATEEHFPGEARDNPDLRPNPVHDIDLVGDSILSTLLQQSRIAVNSLHHQAADRVGGNLRVTAVAHDGTVEAVEGPGSFQVGVQFHPEDLRHSDNRFQRLFERLVESAAGKKS